MGEISGFLEARLVEDEAVAHEALHSVSEDRRNVLTEESTLEVAEDFTWGATGKVEATAARILADVAAKRGIIYAESAPFRIGRTPATRVLCLLAAVYADHPDYRETWRP